MGQSTSAEALPTALRLRARRRFTYPNRPLARSTQFLRTLSSRVEILGYFSAAGFLHRSRSMAEEEILREIADLLAKPKSRSEMVSELLREVAVLLVVFVPLEALFNPGALRWWEIATIVAMAIGVGYVGMRLEETRQ